MFLSVALVAFFCFLWDRLLVFYSFTLDTELQYQCYAGYNTIGFARARCLAYNSTVKWFGPDVTCERQSFLFFFVIFFSPYSLPKRKTRSKQLGANGRPADAPETLLLPSFTEF